MTHDKLLKVKLTIETEFVVHNVYGMVNHKAAINAFSANKDLIVSEAISSGEYELDVSPLWNMDDLPKSWDGNCLPFEECIFGTSEEKNIKTLIKEIHEK